MTRRIGTTGRKGRKVSVISMENTPLKPDDVATPIHPTTPLKADCFLSILPLKMTRLPLKRTTLVDLPVTLMVELIETFTLDLCSVVVLPTLLLRKFMAPLSPRKSRMTLIPRTGASPVKTPLPAMVVSPLLQATPLNLGLETVALAGTFIRWETAPIIVLPLLESIPILTLRLPSRPTVRVVDLPGGLRNVKQLTSITLPLLVISKLRLPLTKSPRVRVSICTFRPPTLAITLAVPLPAAFDSGIIPLPSLMRE